MCAAFRLRYRVPIEMPECRLRRPLQPPAIPRGHRQPHPGRRLLRAPPIGKRYSFDDSFPAGPYGHRERTTWPGHGVEFGFLITKAIRRFWNEHTYDFRHSPLGPCARGGGVSDSFGHTGVTAKTRHIAEPESRWYIVVPSLLWDRAKKFRWDVHISLWRADPLGISGA